MTEFVLRIHNTNPPEYEEVYPSGPKVNSYRQFLKELGWQLNPNGGVYEKLLMPPGPETGGGGDGLGEILITIVASGAVGSALTTLYNALNSYLSKDNSRELTLEREGKRITIKGHSLPEEKELIRELFPEALRERPLTLEDE